MDFDDLPFSTRPDLSPFLVHLTKRRDGRSAFDNLVEILRTGQLIGSSGGGFVKGPNPAVCFMDVPLSALKYVLDESNTNPAAPKYEPYGIVITKPTAYDRGVRPVLYLSNDEIGDLRIPREELWRVVRLEVKQDSWISWLHEREWRCKTDFKIPSKPWAVLVRNLKGVSELQRLLSDPKARFKVRPRCILPLSVVCQGLVYMK